MCNFDQSLCSVVFCPEIKIVRVSTIYYFKHNCQRYIIHHQSPDSGQLIPSFTYDQSININNVMYVAILIYKDINPNLVENRTIFTFYH